SMAATKRSATLEPGSQDGHPCRSVRREARGGRRRPAVGARVAGCPRSIARAMSPRTFRRITLLALAALSAIVVTGGAVRLTASGPHPGSNGDQVVRRLAFSLHSVARLHGTAVAVFLALTLATTWALVRAGAPRGALHRAEALLAVLVAQAGLGYAQYFTGLP